MSLVYCEMEFEIWLNTRFFLDCCVMPNCSQGLKNTFSSPDVVICYSDREAWDYMPLVSSIIPANLGFIFTLLCGHKLRLENTGNMEIRRACFSTGFVWWRMYVLVLVQILQSTLLAVHSCPDLCTCTDGSSGSELRLSEILFVFAQLITDDYIEAL